MDGFTDYNDNPLSRFSSQYRAEDITLRPGQGIGEAELIDKGGEIIDSNISRQKGETGCAWEKYRLTREDAQKAGINYTDCTFNLEVSNLMLDCASRPRTPFCKQIVKAKDTVTVRAKLEQLTEIANYIANKDFKFGFKKAAGLGHDGILKGIWLSYYLGARNGIYKMTHRPHTVHTQSDEAVREVAKDFAKNENVKLGSIKFCKIWADANTKKLIVDKKWKRVAGAGSAVIASLIAIVTVAGVVASALGAAAAGTAGATSGSAGTGATGATAGGASTGGLLAKGAGILGTIGSGVGKGLEWIENNADEIQAGAAVYKAVSDKESQYGISATEATQLAEQQETLHGQAELFQLTPKNALIAGIIVFVVVIAIFIIKRNR